MIERLTIDNRPAIAAYINGEFEPTSVDAATMVKVTFTDDQGGVMFLVPTDIKGVEDRTPLSKDFDEDKHPRDDHGRWSSGGGEGSAASEGGDKGSDKGGTHPGPGYSKDAKLKNGVIYTSNVDDAARALHENRKVELDQPRSVSVLLDKLGEISKDMIKKGEAAPTYNLCNVSVSGTNLFCAQSKGIERVKMPQMTEPQTVEFMKFLQDKGYKVSNEDQFASHLRATQNELNGAKVAGVAKWLRDTPGDNSLRTVVSTDDYILDGHHRWAAKIGNDAADGDLTNDTKMPIARVNIDIIKLLDEAEIFTGGKGKRGVEDKWWPGRAQALQKLEQLRREYNEEDHPRGEGGKWTDSGGGSSGGDKDSDSKDKDKGTHPGPGYSSAARLRGGVIYTPSVYDAQRALFEDRKVELDQPKKISTLIQRLGETAKKMAAAGEKAPNFNLCNVSVSGTNLFCAETKGIPRIEMPQMNELTTKNFRKYLKEQGYKVEKGEERSINLRASQNELVGTKVAEKVAKMKAKGQDKIKVRLIISKDDYIVDGHHKWATQLALDAEKGPLDHGHKMKIARVNIGIIKLLELANKFTGGKGAKAGTN